MQYKTIVLELIQQRPTLHEQLKSSNSLLSTVDRYAIQLRQQHLSLIEQLRETRPESAPLQLSSEAMEIAVKELEDSLPAETETSDGEVFSLDAAMAFLKRHTPRA